MDGYILIDKPKGWTSFDVVNKVRSLIQHSGLNTTGKKRFPVGHTGTLDPLATGLMVILLGNYTKRAPELTKLDKVYEVTMKLGVTSTTGDEEGEKKPVSDKKPSKTALKHVLQSFVGDIEQIPPAYSAVKVDGKRAYNLARAGKTVRLDPRKVRVFSISNLSYHYSTALFTAHVSSGTYIRSLVTDVGEKLGTGAYMSDLRRTRVGTFDITDALMATELTAEQIYQSLKGMKY
jgi:tRNA pseudouridine55 synthase